MAPGRGGRGAPEETVVVDGKTLRRVLDEASKRWVYRPVDAASGETISKEDFEARRREEEAARRASDPRHRAAEEKRWLEQQRGDIREKRAEASRAMRREEHHAALRDGRVERRRPRRKGALGVEVPVPDALAELREEMRLATLRETRKKNPGRFAFIETALAVEERKHETALDAARRRAYAAERRRRACAAAANRGPIPNPTTHPTTRRPSRSAGPRRTWTIRTTEEARPRRQTAVRCRMASPGTSPAGPPVADREAE